MGKLSNVSSKYGAPTGRESIMPDSSWAGKLWVARVPLNSGGYDDGGAYWGMTIENLYVVHDADGDVLIFLRALTRAVAREKVLATMLPLAKFVAHKTDGAK